jgi:tetratricopeptide (TPR) repeat protein
MTDLHDRYSHLIQTIVQQSLAGQIGDANENYIYDRLADELEPDTAALFEHCLDDQVLIATQQLVAGGAGSYASQRLQVLKLIQTEWQRYQQAWAAQTAVAQAMHRISSASQRDRLTAFATTIDPNPGPDLALTIEQLQQLATTFRLMVGQGDRQEFATGISQGLESWSAITPHLTSWLEPGAGKTAPSSPWELWAAQPIGPLPKAVFQVLQHQKSLADWAADCGEINLTNWIDLIVVLQRIQRELLDWANQQPYEATPARQLITSLYLGFTGTWAQIASGVGRSVYLNGQNREQFSRSATQVGWQFLRQFAQSQHFPFYGNPLTLLGEQNLQHVTHYLNQPPIGVEPYPEKARILHLMAISLQVAGHYSQSIALHQTGLAIAQQFEDLPCTIAHLNHLSRLAILANSRSPSQNPDQWERAIAHSERALILSRQVGDAAGEANALANLGAATAHQQLAIPSKIAAYESPMAYLMQAVDKAKALTDQPSHALCATSLGQICLRVGHPAQALLWIQTGLELSALCGDSYLQSRNFAAMAQACDELQHPSDAIYAACLALHHFDRLNCPEWRQTAALLSQMQGRLGDRFEELLQNELGEIIRQIGVEGFAQIPELIERYRRDA